jgi:DNA-binding LacI/PurR family transcriptional regulator
VQQLNPAFADLRLDPGSELSFLGQIRVQVMLLIADGRLEPGSRLPSVRALADHLGVNVNTVRAAYARLEGEGIVLTRHGVGTTVLAAGSGSLSPGVPRYMSNTVGVIIAGLDPFYLDLLRGIEAKADETGTLLFIVDIRDSEERARIAIRQLTARGAQGIIAVSMGGPAETDRPDSTPPIVYVDQPDRAGHTLLFNAERAGDEATRHLLDHGHDRIGYVTCPLDWPNQRELFDGHRRALADAGRSLDPSLIAVVAGFDVASGQAGTRSLFGQPDPPSAVLASGGMLAVGVLQAARRHGLRVPDDLAIAGYGDSGVAEFTHPALTMVSLPTYDIGVAAMGQLQRAIADPAAEPHRRVLDGTLVIRESCGPHEQTHRLAS